MITHSTVHLTIDVNTDVTPEELAAVREFIDIEQDRISMDFGRVFGLKPGIGPPVLPEMRMANKRPKRRKSRWQRLKKVYGI